MPAAVRVRAWRPRLAGVEEVFHAAFGDHAYPMHTHDSWTVLMIDTGAVSYALDRREHGALTSLVTLLPPHVPHDGRAARPSGFRKRVLYLDPAVIDAGLIGAAVDGPSFADPVLRRDLSALHDTFEAERLGPVEPWRAESGLALVTGRLVDHLRHREPAPLVPDPSLAGRLRELLDADPVTGPSLAEAAGLLGADPRHLVRVFTRRFGLPPHRYLTGRRVDRARRLLLAGRPAGEAAVLAGFYDQSHLTRHLRTMIGTTPGRYAGGRSGR